MLTTPRGINILPDNWEISFGLVIMIHNPNIIQKTPSQSCFCFHIMEIVFFIITKSWRKCVVTNICISFRYSQKWGLDRSTTLRVSLNWTQTGTKHGMVVHFVGDCKIMNFPFKRCIATLFQMEVLREIIPNVILEGISKSQFLYIWIILSNPRPFYF